MNTNTPNNTRFTTKSCEEILERIKILTKEGVRLKEQGLYEEYHVNLIMISTLMWVLE